MRTLRVVHMTSVHSALDHRIFKKECRSLARAGFDVTVVGPHPQDSVQELVRIKRVPKHRARFLRMTVTAWRVYRKAAQQDADIYHFHDPELIPAGLLLRARGKIVIYDVHEDYPKDIFVKSYLPHWLRQAISRGAGLMEISASKRFSAIVAVTPTIAARFAAINDRTVVLHNYPYAQELSNGHNGSWDTRKQAVAYIGTITPERGIADLVRAMGLLPDSLTATLEIAGDNIPKQVAALDAWSRVNYHGVLDQLSTYKLLRTVRAGLVCQPRIPRFMEAMPVKIFEYMGAGLPIIASDFPQWRKMLEGVECALFVDSQDIRQIARAIEFLLTHSPEAEAMGLRGQEAVAKRFNWNTQAHKLVDLYTGLVTPSCAG